MKNICLYFQVHQPFRLNNYSFFQIGSDEAYFDEMMNRDILRRVAYNCYLPFNGLLLRLIESTGYRLQVSFSLSSTVIEQLLWYVPEVLDSFRALVATGCVELLGETAAHSLAAIVSEKEFREQVRAHTHLIYDLFGQMPQTFRNTELIYADSIAPIINDLGFDSILADAGHDVLQWRSPNYIYAAAGCPAVKLLLKNGQLSDDIAFRFADRGWKEWPLSPNRYISWLNAIPGDEQLLNLFMDYETFGGQHNYSQ
ncbi:alpha-amylase [Chitinophaga sp. YR627]|uniref:glycoside hydrolase family 57 protein n=1 Tax=Chitinophaga sp. YR627 TaxID=1881041 RepID=UPI0008E22F24|nr:glycoside hydrolase family 57 protein [Chitinophaga sp. YR627]SFM71401.1 alpha-amylase [Chitinophaga sp. YR627]